MKQIVFRRSTAFVSVSSMILLFAMSGCSTPQTNSVSETDGEPDGETPAQKWGYSGEIGPENWADLSDDYHLCDTGKNQSPVDITETKEAELPGLEFDYNDQAEAVHRKQTSVELAVPTDNTLTVGDERFELQQFHFHSPAEHTIDGDSYPLELHLVHENDEGETAVVAVLYEEGEKHKTIYRILNYLPPGVGESRRLNTADVNPADLLPEDQSYFRYNGSLTTPPCTEGVRWYVIKETPTVSTSQIEDFKKAVGGPNARPVQPLNARIILE